MATGEGVETPSVDYAHLNLETLVSEATWKDILIDLVKKENLDPWNIDITSIVEKYIETVKQMKVLDLRVPANIILAAAILLRMKSEMLSFAEEVVEEPEIMQDRPGVTVGQLSLRVRVPPKRRISLQELIDALEEAMKIKEMREIAEMDGKKIDIPININLRDIEEEINELYTEIGKIADKSKMTTFSLLMERHKGDDILLGVFIPLLFLAHKQKVTLMQEKFFDEIIIALNK
jgi:segregation and condensation protein A